jgi:hypothetical protein
MALSLIQYSFGDDFHGEVIVEYLDGNEPYLIQPDSDAIPEDEVDRLIEAARRRYYEALENQAALKADIDYEEGL